MARSLILAIATILVAAVVAFGLAGGRHDPASAQAAPTLFIDANADNGCQASETSRTVNTGQTYKVGLCLSYTGSGPDSFRLVVIYNGSTNLAPEVADTGEALNDNPDFNEAVGTNWSCTGFGVAFPKGDDPVTAGIADAVISCNSKSFEPSSLASPALLATLTFQAAAADEEELRFGDESDIFAETCGGGAIICNGATIVKQGEGSPISTPTPTSTRVVCQVDGATCTPTPPAFDVNRTVTPTPTATTPATEPPAATPPAGAAPSGPAATPPANVGGVVKPPAMSPLPRAGSGSDRMNRESMDLVWLAVAVGIAGVVVGLHVRTAGLRK